MPPWAAQPSNSTRQQITTCLFILVSLVRALGPDCSIICWRRRAGIREGAIPGRTDRERAQIRPASAVAVKSGGSLDVIDVSGYAHKNDQHSVGDGGGGYEIGRRWADGRVGDCHANVVGGQAAGKPIADRVTEVVRRVAVHIRGGRRDVENKAAVGCYRCPVGAGSDYYQRQHVPVRIAGIGQQVGNANLGGDASVSRVSSQARSEE